MNLHQYQFNKKIVIKLSIVIPLPLNTSTITVFANPLHIHLEKLKSTIMLIIEVICPCCLDNLCWINYLLMNMTFCRIFFCVWWITDTRLKFSGKKYPAKNKSLNQPGEMVWWLHGFKGFEGTNQLNASLARLLG